MEEEKFVLEKEEDPVLINYLMLIQTIMFSDYDDGGNFAICVYDTEENDRLVAIFNNDNGAARMFGMTKLCIQQYRKYDRLIKSRFKTERFRCETTSSKAEFYQIMMNEGNKKEMEYIRKKMQW
jgi:hypothetical protein